MAQADKESAVLVGLNIERAAHERDLASLDELALLADTADFQPALKLLFKRDRIDPAYYIGSGKTRELRRIIADKEWSTVILDFELSPVQARNIERILQCRLITRTELILGIFERRARTKEAQLQVELAMLMYSLPRLRHLWTHLERIEGYIGSRGPGEKQIELDRRRISKRIDKIKKDLAAVKTHRMVIRKNRKYRNKIALVGYTNAGKSSLLNTLCHSALHTENRLFSTLDPATREIWLANGVSALATDTVGFIKRLPHTLIASFRATLEEVTEADLLLHVVDVASPEALEQIEAVNEVLREISADSVPVLHVFNKVDLLPSRDMRLSLLSRFERRVVVSAKTGEGIRELKNTLHEFFTRSLRPVAREGGGRAEGPERGSRPADDKGFPKAGSSDEGGSPAEAPSPNERDGMPPRRVEEYVPFKH